jgi:hypothetical protein
VKKRVHLAFNRLSELYKTTPMSERDKPGLFT